MVSFEDRIVQGGEETLAGPVEIEKLLSRRVLEVVAKGEGQGRLLVFLDGNVDRGQTVIVYVIDIDSSFNQSHC